MGRCIGLNEPSQTAAASLHALAVPTWYLKSGSSLQSGAGRRWMRGGGGGKSKAGCVFLVISECQ